MEQISHKSALNENKQTGKGGNAIKMGKKKLYKKSGRGVQMPAEVRESVG